MNASHFLTRLEINPRRRLAPKYLSSPQVMHAAIEAAFSGQTAGERRLWRIDTIGEAVWLYIVSATKPDLTHLVEHIGRPATSSWETKDYQPFLQRLSNDQIWSFRLTANPVHSVRKEAGSSTTKRLGHVTVDFQQKWLLDRLSGWGMSPVIGIANDSNNSLNESPIRIVGREIIRFIRNRNSDQRQRITLTKVSYEGLIRISNVEQLRFGLVNGFGHAKAYGCGLLTLARL